MKKKILLIVFSILMTIGSIPNFVFANDDINNDVIPVDEIIEIEEVTDNGEIQGEDIVPVIENESSVEEISETLEVIPIENDEKNDIDLSKADGIDFSSKRLLVAVNDKHALLDDEKIISQYEDLYLIEYDTELSAKKAYVHYLDNAEFVEPDADVFVSEGEILDSDIYSETDPLSELEKQVDIDKKENNEIYERVPVIALVDTGVSEDAQVVLRVSMIGDDVNDDNGHGNKMLSFIKQENSKAKVLSIKALDKNGKGTITSIVAAIEYAIEQKVDIINLAVSAISKSDNAVLSEVIKKANDAGIQVVGAAGNNGKNVKYYIPGNIEDVIVVGSANKDGERQAFSNYGETVDFNVISDSTSEAASVFSAILARDGISTINSNINTGNVFATDYIKPIIQNEVISIDVNNLNGEIGGEGWYYGLDGKDELILSEGYTFELNGIFSGKVINFGRLVNSVIMDIDNYNVVQDSTINGVANLLTITYKTGSEEKILNGVLLNSEASTVNQDYSDDVVYPENSSTDFEVQTKTWYYSYQSRQKSTTTTTTRPYNNVGPCPSNVSGTETPDGNGGVICTGTITVTVPGGPGPWSGFSACSNPQDFNSCPKSDGSRDIFVKAEIRNSFDEVVHDYVANGQGMKNLWEIHHADEPFKAYCFSQHTGSPKGLYSRYEATVEFVESHPTVLNQYNNYQSKPASDKSGVEGALEGLKTVLYYGYPHNAAGIQEKYGLTDAQFASATHNAIWWYSDGNPGYKSTGYSTGASMQNGTYYYTENMAKAATELVNMKFSSIPNGSDLKFYFYVSNDGWQNVLAMESIQDVYRGGVLIRKQSSEVPGEPLAGAVFGIYDSENNLVKEVTSDKDGLATLCKTDEYDGLVFGTYTVRELIAPPGHEKSNDYFTFTVEADGQIVEKGYRNGGSSLETIFFDNKPIADWDGGGVEIQKKDAVTGIVVPQAEYTLYNQEGIAVKRLVTDHEGKASTGKSELPVGTYTLKETDPPYGYGIDTETYILQVTKDTFVSLNTLTDPPKEGHANVFARKELYRATASGEEMIPVEAGAYKFEIYKALYQKEDGTMELEKLGEATNDAEGVIQFPTLHFIGEDAVAFHIKEVPTSSDINYDKSTKYANVNFIDDGSDVLIDLLSYDEVDENGNRKEPTFKNVRKSQDISGLMWVDMNGDGLQTEGEPKIKENKVCLYRDTKSKFAKDDKSFVIDGLTLYPAYTRSGVEIPCQQTDENGAYLFEDVEEGNYFAVAQGDMSFKATRKDAGDDTLDNDATDILATRKDGTTYQEAMIIKNIHTKEWDNVNNYYNNAHNDFGITSIPQPGNPTSNTAVVKSSDPISGSKVNVEDEITYFITVKNTEYTYISQNVITDEIPVGTTYVENSADNDGVYEDGVITWKKTTLAPNEEFVVSFKVKVNEDAPRNIYNYALYGNEGKDPVPTNKTVHRTTDKVIPNDPMLSSLKTSNPVTDTLVEIDDQIEYTVKLTNTGVVDAKGVVIIDPLPIGVEFVSAKDSGTFNKDKERVEWYIGDLPVGESVEVSFTVKTSDKTPSYIENTAYYDIDINKEDISKVDPRYQTNTVVHIMPVIGDKVTVTKSSISPSGSKVENGETIKYILDVVNTSIEESISTTVWDYIPKGTTYVKGSASNGGKFNESKNMVEWTLGPIKANESVQLTFEVTVDENAPKEIFNHALYTSVGGGNDDKIHRTNETVHHLTKEPIHTELQLTKSSNPAPSKVKMEEQIEYTLEITNTSEVLAKDIAITDVIPEHTVLVEVKDNGVYNEKLNRAEWYIGNLEPWKSAIVHFVVKVDTNCGIIENQARYGQVPKEVLPNVELPNASNILLHYVDPIDVPSVVIGDYVTVYKSSDPVSGTILKAGDEITYKLTAKNTGIATSGKTTIKDELNELLEYVDGSASDGGTYSDGVITWTISGLKPQEERSVTFKAKIKENVRQAIIRNHAVYSTDTDKYKGDKKTNETVHGVGDVTLKPALNLVKTNNPIGIVKKGDEITYTLKLENHGGISRDTVITDAIPEGSTFVSASDGGKLNNSKKRVEWYIGDLEPGKSVVRTFKVKTTIDEGVIDNQALFDSDIKESELSNSTPKNSSNIVQNFLLLPPVKKIVDAGGNDVSGQTLRPVTNYTYEITVKNPTKSDLAMTLSDKLPSEVTFVSADSDGKNASGTITWNLTLKGGESKTVKVVIKTPNKTVTFKNKATLTVDKVTLESNEVTNNIVEAVQTGEHGKTVWPWIGLIIVSCIVLKTKKKFLFSE